MKDQKPTLTVRPHFGPPERPYKTTDVFVLMPFSDNLRPVYDDHIVKVTQHLSLTVARADDFFSAQTIMGEIWSALCHAQAVIADCTGRNPNVFYEIGLAHVIGKPVILITQDSDDVPFDLRHLRYILYEYTPRGIQLFEERLSQTLKVELGLDDSGKSRFTPILFLAANPIDMSHLRLGQEQREISETLQRSRNRDLFAIHSVFASRRQDITQALLDLKPRIVHFSGHGSSTGEICLEDNNGNAQSVQPEALAGLFKLVSKYVECVILNACFSEEQARVIVTYVNYVIGIPHVISDEASIAFATGFYQAISAGSSIKEAYEFGCVQLQLIGTLSSSLPVLITRDRD